MSAFYKIGEFADKIGVHIETLRRWDKEGTLKPAKVTEGGTRYYSEQQYNEYCGRVPRNKKREIILYCRVSESSQRDDLERQIENVKQYAYAKGYQFELVTDIGSGVDYGKKGFLYLVDKIIDCNVEKVIILSKDRLVQFGYQLIEHICEKTGTEIEIIDNTEVTKQEELVEDLILIATDFNSRLTGRQLNKIITELKEGGSHV